MDITIEPRQQLVYAHKAFKSTIKLLKCTPGISKETKDMLDRIARDAQALLDIHMEIVKNGWDANPNIKDAWDTHTYHANSMTYWLECLNKIPERSINEEESSAVSTAIPAKAALNQLIMSLLAALNDGPGQRIEIRRSKNV